MGGKGAGRGVAILAFGLLLAGCAEAPPERNRSFERATMEEIAEALALALPLSLSEERLADPADLETFHTALRTLAHQAGRLESHGRGREASFAYLSRSLANDARDALRRFDYGERSEARFLLQQLIDDCIACHSRLPSPDSQLGQRLLGQVDTGGLTLEERARLETATRRFDAALGTYEQLFQSPATPPGQLDLEGLLVDYLLLCVRVKQDLERPQPTLEGLQQRRDLPGYLERDLGAWIAALKSLGQRPAAAASLASARALAREANLRDASRYERAGLVHALTASGQLHGYLSQGGHKAEELAEAYYLLGLTETRIHHSWWLSEADVYLETSIRSSPDTIFAELAFELLELETLAGYTGSSGAHLPEDVRLRLEELRALIDAAGAAGPG